MFLTQYQHARWSPFNPLQCPECGQHFVDTENRISMFDTDICIACIKTLKAPNKEANSSELLPLWK